MADFQDGLREQATVKGDRLRSQVGDGRRGQTTGFSV